MYILTFTSFTRHWYFTNTNNRYFSKYPYFKTCINAKIPEVSLPRGSLSKTATTYSPTICSTIGVTKLNFSVRNGKRWNLRAIVTLISFCISSLAWSTNWKSYFSKTPFSQALNVYNTLMCYAITKVNGQLVMLGFAVSSFTPASYQRRSLRRPWEILSCGRLRT